MKQGRKKLKNKEKYLTENLYGKVLTYNVFIFYTNLFVPCEVHVHAISGGNFGGVGWGGGAIATSRRIVNLSEIFILSEVRKYVSFSDKTVIISKFPTN